MVESRTSERAENTTAVPPLAGLKVLDLTRVLAGPYCTMILADLGADVVKIERPETGDEARSFGPFLPSGASAYFASLNRGKSSIVLDLKVGADRDTFLQLAKQADVLVENFRPGTLERLGFSWERLRELNPRLIYASISGYGHEGNHRERPSYDVIAQGEWGPQDLTGETDGSPMKLGISIADLTAGMHAV
ncbi:MAG TPA: CoA transferase, partial [Fuerstia sp.]|nr:CoA transferase [Fuerstiella sp.]